MASREDRDADAFLQAEANKLGLDLKQWGILSKRRLGRCTCAPDKKPCGRINHFEKHSLEGMRESLLLEQDEEEA